MEAPFTVRQSEPALGQLSFVKRRRDGNAKSEGEEGGRPTRAGGR